jgi:hypothetical protein
VCWKYSEHVIKIKKWIEMNFFIDSERLEVLIPEGIDHSQNPPYLEYTMACYRLWNHDFISHRAIHTHHLFR